MMLGFPGGSEVKNLPANAEDMSSVPWLGRSYGEGNDNPLQYWCLANSTDRGAWETTVHGVTKSRTRLSDFTFTFQRTIHLPLLGLKAKSKFSVV